MADPALYKRHKADLEKLWDEFRKWRDDTGQWTQMIRRRRPIELQPELSEYAQGIDIQSPILEEESILRKHILTLNPAKVDCVAQETGVRAIEDVEDCRNYFARLLADLDDGMKASDPMSANQVQYGVHFWRRTWHMPKEPDPLGREDDEEDEAYNKRSSEARDSYFRDYKQKIFGLERVPLGALMFMPLDNPVVFLEEVEIDYLEWRELKNQSGKYATLDDAGKVLFIGDAKEPDSGESASKKLKLIRHAYREPGTDDWKMCEYLSEGGVAEEGDVLNEYDVPGGAPYDVVPAGEEQMNETNPHLRYRPQMYPLYVAIGDWNYLITLLTAWARKRMGDQAMYVEIGAVNEEGRNLLQNMGFQLEGAGAQTRLLFDLPEPGSRQLMIAPKLSEVPLPRPEEIVQLILLKEREIQQLRSNRFLTGSPTPQEITQGTATAITSATQQAGIPPSASVRKQAAGWKRYFLWVRNTILAWDPPGTPTTGQKKYATLTSGQEPTYGTKVEPGTEIAVDANKMGRKFETIVYIRNITDAEQAQRDAIALNKYDRGLLTLEQLLDEMGFDDPEKQKEELNKERHRRSYLARYEQIETTAKDTLLSALSGINLQALLQPGMEAAPTSAPEGQGPSSNGNGVPQAPGQRQAVTPPPMTSPQGNSSAMAGTPV